MLLEFLSVHLLLFIIYYCFHCYTSDTKPNTLYVKTHLAINLFLKKNKMINKINKIKKIKKKIDKIKYSYCKINEIINK